MSMPRRQMEVREAGDQVKERWRSIFDGCSTDQLREIVESAQDVSDVVAAIEQSEEDEDLSLLSLQEFKAMAEEILLSRGER